MLAEPKRRGRPPKIKPESLRDAGRNAAEQGNEPDIAPAAPAAPEFSAPPASVETLADYIAVIEGSRLADGIVLVSVTHPDASGQIHQGRFSGIRTLQGPRSALWSDGTASQPDA